MVVAACADPGGRDFSITPRVFPTFTPTPEPQPTATPRPRASPTRTAAPRQLYIANTGGQGAVLRAEPPTGARVAGLRDGTSVTPQGDELEAGGRRWVRVRDPDGRLGWIAAEFLTESPPGTPGRGGTATATPVAR